MPRLPGVLLVAALSIASSSAIAGERTGDAALGALSGAVVLGPIGAVAGAVVGYTTGPDIAHAWGWRSSPHKPRRVARGSAPAAKAGEPARATQPRPDRAPPAPSVNAPAPTRSAGAAVMPPAQSLE